MSAIIIKCGCCGDDVEETKATRDSETQDLVCPECRKDLRNAKAILAQPADNLGHPISIKGVYTENDAPDNL